MCPNKTQHAAFNHTPSSTNVAQTQKNTMANIQVDAQQCRNSHAKTKQTSPKSRLLLDIRIKTVLAGCRPLKNHCEVNELDSNSM